MMPIRVAELGALFTGNIDDFEAKARTVEGKQREIDASITEAEVRAEIDDAMALLGDMASELDEIARTDTEAAITADVDPALRSLDDVRDELDGIARDDVSVNVDVDSSGAERGLKRAGEGMGEFRDEADSTAREAAASFDGSAESIGDVFQELSANAFAGFGPAGAIAGVAAAAGLGAAISAAQELAEENTAAAEAGAEIGPAIADGLFDAREDFRAWATEVREDNAWTFWKDEAEANITAVADSFHLLGEEGAQAFAAVADADLGGMNDSLSRMNAELEVLYEKNMAGVQERALGAMGGVQDVTHETEMLTEAERTRMEALEEVGELLSEQIEKHEDAREIARALIRVEEEMTEAQAERELQLRDTNAAIAEQNDLQQTSIEAGLDLADGLADLSDKEDGWKSTLDEGTQAGRDNIREIINLTDDIEALGEATLEQEGKQSIANEAMREAREDLLDQAEAAGHSRGEVEDLIDTILEIPDEVDTEITADARQARRTGREARRYLNELHAEIDVDADTGNAYAQANAVQRYISGLNATVDVYSRPVAGPNSSHGGPTFAEGGRVEGPGTETSDSIIARLSDEEHVWTAAEVRGAGGHAEVERLRQLAKAGKLPGFADGGPVIVTGATPTPAQARASQAPAGMQVIQYITNHYPQAEPTSVTTNRALGFVGAIGLV